MCEMIKENVEMTPSAPRIVAALYFVIEEAQKRGKSVSQYDLVKTLFLADRKHLNEWGRPITYDNYRAMLHGPVPSLSYDFLKGNAKAMRDHGLEGLPWTTTHHRKNQRHYHPATGSISPDDFLSESDMQALKESLGVVLTLGFAQIRRLTHEDPAYIEAWKEDGGKAAYAMKLGLLFEEPNYEQAAALAEYSPYV